MDDVTFYRDPAGKVHRVHVLDVGKKMTLIEYLDNARRGTMFRNGRRINHATRVRIYVYHAQLWTGGGE